MGAAYCQTYTVLVFFCDFFTVSCSINFKIDKNVFLANSFGFCSNILLWNIFVTDLRRKLDYFGLYNQNFYCVKFFYLKVSPSLKLPKIKVKMILNIEIFSNFKMIFFRRFSLKPLMGVHSSINYIYFDILSLFYKTL